MTIPVLDWTGFAHDPDAFLQGFRAACRGTGFFCLTWHGIDSALMDQVFTQADWFFALPDARKRPLAINAQNRGWAAQGTERLDETSGQIDRKEAFNVGLDLAPDDPRILAGEAFRGLNIWPENAAFRDTMLAYFDAVWRLGVALHKAVARDLDLPHDYFADHFDAPLATLRLLHYPPATGQPGEIGAGAHTDYGSLTLLKTDGEPGLQVRTKAGDWTDVPHVPEGFVVNIGDCLMRWTNDIYQSTPHRVLPPKRQRRSVAFFLDPNPDSLIAALPGTGDAKYPAVTGADYLRSRLEATYERPAG
jgi:isopenicillin N synthase-like dioxygenase